MKRKPAAAQKPKPRSNDVDDDFARILLFIRRVRNMHEIGPHPIRSEAVAADDALERAIGKDGMDRVYKSRTWNGTWNDR